MRISNLHEFWFASKDGMRIACKRWQGRGPARCVIQIAHGMGEHSGRFYGQVRANLLVWLSKALRDKFHHSEAL